MEGYFTMFDHSRLTAFCSSATQQSSLKSRENPTHFDHSPMKALPVFGYSKTALQEWILFVWFHLESSSSSLWPRFKVRCISLCLIIMKKTPNVQISGGVFTFETLSSFMNSSNMLLQARMFKYI